MNVGSLQGIDRPLDQIEAQCEVAIALQPLETDADTRAPIILEDSEHMRPLHRMPVLDARDRVHEGDQLVAFKGTDQNPAPLHSYRQDRHRHDLVVPRSPDAVLEIDYRSEVLERGEISIRQGHW